MWRPIVLVLGLCLAGCSSSSTPAAPSVSVSAAGLDSIFTLTISDPAGDFLIAPQEGPPVLMQHPPADVTSVRLGMSGPYLYVQANYAAAIPGGPVTIPAQQGMPLQFVREQGIGFNFNVDGNDNTGAQAFPVIAGIDIFFALRVKYGSPTIAYANWDFASRDIHLNRGHMDGTVVDGGGGSSRVTARFDVSSLGNFFPRGAAVVVGGWSEAESSDANGNVIYHHFAYDPYTAVPWTIPR